MQLNLFLEEDLDLFRMECNFSDTESQIFELKAKGKTDVYVSDVLGMSASNVAVYMRKIRAKIDEVLRRNVRHISTQESATCSRCIVCHSMGEWAKIPDFLSGKGVLYIYSDYRTENGIDIPRIKIGDGVHSLSEIPFATMSITDADMAYWDDKPDTDSNDFGKVVEVGIDYTFEYFVFPADGYMMLEFDNAQDFAIVNIYGASGNSYFMFEKRQGIDIHSKEVFVKRGMKCQYVNASSGAKIKFIPLV